MREIKFLAWDRLKKQMFFVEAITYVKKTGLPKYVYYVGNKSPHSIRTETTLLQYTGLKDKNGKEIYEGDIVRYNTGEAWIVKWSGRGGFIYADNGNKNTAATNQLPDMHEVEVIGNIYENPELLK